jgi:hypothetical protein
MLQYAAKAAEQKFGINPPEGSAAASLLDSLEDSDPESAIAELTDVVECLFRDAKVDHARVSSRGESYSIVEEAVAEFVRRDLMPWEA